MTPTLPEYFTELRPFAEHFKEGAPILCYHKIEPPPPQARIKGLYLKPELFSRQLRELKRSGFDFIPPGLPVSVEKRTITITFDDGFLTNLTQAGPQMTAVGCHAINYLVADRIGKTSDWEAAEGGRRAP